MSVISFLFVSASERTAVIGPVAPHGLRALRSTVSSHLHTSLGEAVIVLSIPLFRKLHVYMHCDALFHVISYFGVRCRLCCKHSKPWMVLLVSISQKILTIPFLSQV